MTGDGVNVVIGVGNRMRGDDAAGPIVIDRLQGRLPDSVHLVESQGDPVRLLGWWQSAGLSVVIDAVKTGAKPGTIYRFKGDHRLPAGFFRQSTHLVGLADAVEMARTLDRLPATLVLFGIEAESMEVGAPLGVRVAQAIDDVLESIVEMFATPQSEAVEGASSGA